MIFEPIEDIHILYKLMQSDLIKTYFLRKMNAKLKADGKVKIIKGDSISLPSPSPDFSQKLKDILSSL